MIEAIIGPSFSDSARFVSHSGSAMHRRDRPGDLDEEPAHGGDAAVDLECGQRFDGPFHGGKGAIAFLRHRLPHQPFVYASR